MAILLLVLASIFLGVLAVHAYKQFQVRQQRRIADNEYSAAVAIWEFARNMKQHVDTSKRESAGTLDFRHISVPHSQGYRFWMELIGVYFRVYAVPNRYNRTGRLSFLTDNTLSVRASDREGQQATSEDMEYKGDQSL